MGLDYLKQGNLQKNQKFYAYFVVVKVVVKKTGRKIKIKIQFKVCTAIGLQIIF